MLYLMLDWFEGIALFKTSKILKFHDKAALERGILVSKFLHKPSQKKFL